MLPCSHPELAAADFGPGSQPTPTSRTSSKHGTHQDSTDSTTQISTARSASLTFQHINRTAKNRLHEPRCSRAHAEGTE